MTGEAWDQAGFLFASASGTRPSQLSLGRRNVGIVQFGVSGVICQIWVGFFFFLKPVWELAP